MAVVLTYEPALSSVRITVTGIAAAVDYVLIERSTDQVVWVTVRGGAAVAVVAGTATLDDYEFADSVVNYYRATGYDTSPPAYVAAGAAATGANPAGTSTLTPALPAGLAQGDLLLVLASIRNSGVGTVNVPTGYTMLWDGANMRLFGKMTAAGEAAPLVSFTGGVANATVLGQTAAIRNVGLPAAATSGALNATALNIAYPALVVPADDAAVIVAGWKQDDWTSVATLAGMTEIGEAVTTGGDDAGQVWDYVLQTTATNITAGSFTVTGGLTAISRAAVVALPRVDRPASVETSSITPSLVTPGVCTDRVIWVKSISRPFLNRAVIAQFATNFTIARDARLGVFNVVGRSLPIAVNDLRTSRQWTMYVETRTIAEADEFELILASGEPLFIHVPPYCAYPGGYVAVGDVTRNWQAVRPERSRFVLPLTLVAAPGPDVVGAVGTWQTVINTYATWADVIAAHATWADLLTLAGSPADVVVP